MAEETQTTEETQESNSKEKKSPIGLLMVLSVAIMILTPIITIVAFRIMTRDVREAVEEPRLEPVEVSLPRLQVNVAEANGTRYAQIDIEMEVSDSSLVPLLTEHEEEDPPSRLKRVMAIIIGITSEKPINALLSADGKHKLAMEIKDSVNDFLSDKTSEMVTDVYFSGFLIQ